MAGLRFGNGDAETRYWTDTWDGYPVARDRLTQALTTPKPRNPVVLSGAHQSFWSNAVKLVSTAESSPQVPTEIFGTSLPPGAHTFPPLRWGAGQGQAL